MHDPIHGSARAVTNLATGGGAATPCAKRSRTSHYGRRVADTARAPSVANCASLESASVDRKSLGGAGDATISGTSRPQFSARLARPVQIGRYGSVRRVSAVGTKVGVWEV